MEEESVGCYCWTYFYTGHGEGVGGKCNTILNGLVLELGSAELRRKISAPMVANLGDPFGCDVK
jgi:hypothetical protein